MAAMDTARSTSNGWGIFDNNGLMGSSCRQVSDEKGSHRRFTGECSYMKDREELYGYYGTHFKLTNGEDWFR